MNINDIGYFQFIEDFQQLNGIYQVSKIVDYASIIDDGINLFELYESIGVQDRYNSDKEEFLLKNETFYTLTDANDILNNNSVQRVYTIPKFIMGDFIPDTTNISKYSDFVMMMELGSFKTDDIRIKPIVEELKQKASRYFNYAVNTSLATSNNRYDIVDSSIETDNIIKSPQTQLDELTKLNHENIDLKEKLKALEDLVLAIPRLEARKEELINEISGAQLLVNSNIESEQLKLDALEESVQLIQNELNRLIIEKNKTDQQIIDNDAEVARLLALIASLETQKVGLTGDLDDTVAGLRIQLAQEQAISETLREDKAEQVLQIGNLRTEITTKQNQITDLELTITNLRSQISTKDAELAGLLRDISNVNANIVTLNDEKAALQATINQNANRLNELNDELRLERNRLVANAGDDQTVNSQTEVTLDASDSTIPENVIIKWESYKNDDLPPIILNNPDSAISTFTSPALSPGEDDVVYSFLLTLRISVTSEGEDNDNSDIVYITVKSPNQVPTANAGNDQNVISNALVTLDGSNSSDPDGDDSNLTYLWERTGGTEGRNVRLVHTNSIRPTFVSDSIIPGAPSISHIFTLTVTDEEGGTDTDIVNIIVTGPPAPNRAPIARAGSHRTVFSGETVTLDGSGSYDPDGNDSTLTYLWEHTSDLPSGVVEPVLEDSRAQITTFTADIIFSGDPISHEYTLTVTDTEGATGTVTVVITVQPNAGPIVNAGDDRTVETGDIVIINGSGRDPDGGNVTYQWVKVGGTGRSDILTSPAVVTNTPTLTFTADTLTAGSNNVTHLFQLIVTEVSSTPLTSSDTVRIKILAPNTIPVARAGNDRSVRDNSLITLDGSQSYDPDGGQITYAWERLRGTGNSNLVLNDADTSTPSFRSDDLSSSTSTVTHVFRLRVTDDRGGIHSDEITITVRLTI